MRIITIIMAVMCLFSAAAAENPDSRPSIQINIGGGGGDGHQEVFGYTIQKYNADRFDFGGNLVFPAGNDVTIIFSGNYATANTEWLPTLNRLGTKFKGKGYSLALSFRFYIGESINK